MQEFALNQAIFFHAFINYATLCIVAICGILLFCVKDFVKINKISFYATPLFCGFLFVDFLSGVSVWAMMGFAWSGKIALMILANFMFILEIVRIKILRKARQILRFRERYLKIARIFYVVYALIFVAFLVV
ncbi:hypothetical protein [Helicobacter sp. 23-1045]